MVEPHRGARGDQIVMIVLQFGQAPGQRPDAAAEHIRAVGRAMRRLDVLPAPALDPGADEIPDGFGAGVVTAILTDFVKRGAQPRCLSR